MLTIVPTVDTEGFHGSAPFERFILGQVDGSDEEWGVFRIQDICRRNGASATFFTDATESIYWGEDKFRDLTRRLVDTGGDIQLHTHPEFRGPKDAASREPAAERILGPSAGRIRGPMTGLTFDQQRAFLEAGMDMIKRWTGVAPVAHRSGGYAINADTVRALAAIGIPLDSSMNTGHTNSKVTWSTNAVVERDGVIELPVTNQDYRLRLASAELYRRAIKTDINACSVSELVAYVDDAVRGGATLMNLFMHSYSLLRFDRRYRRFSPDRAAARRLDRFLALMRGREGVRVMTCAQVLNRYRKAPTEFAGPDVIPARNAAALIARRGMQEIRRFGERFGP
jgi:peptidoglycan/xylan/chitin deacetylase (PgdA/CDA1 family)